MFGWVGRRRPQQGLAAEAQVVRRGYLAPILKPSRQSLCRRDWRWTMRSKAFLLPICSIFVISVASPTQVASQMPRAAITGLARDSIGLQLTRPAYVAVFERLAHKAVHVLYPPLDQDWAALASGPNTIRVTSTLLRALAAKPDLTRQCIVEPTQT